MLKQEQIEVIESDIRIAKIIHLAMVVGVFFFGVVACAITPWEDAHWDVTIMSAIGLFAGLSMLALSVVAPRIVNATAAKVTADDLKTADKLSMGEKGIKKFAVQFQSSNIIRMALLEGAAFLNCAIFFIDKSLIALSVAGFCLLVLAIGFPTTNRFISWIENQMEQVQNNMRAG